MSRQANHADSSDADPTTGTRRKRVTRRPARSVTAQDVARKAGVSLGTVSRVVNGVAAVKPESRARVQQAIAELGWVPNMAAQAMRGASSRMIGFIFSDIRNPQYSAMVKGAEDVLIEHGYLLMIASSDGQPQREIALLDLFRMRKADGLLFTPDQESNVDVRAALHQTGIAHVLVEREFAALRVPDATGHGQRVGANDGEGGSGNNTIAGGCSVGVDHYHGMLDAARYLIQLGHRRIALITGGPDTRVGHDRKAALLQALGEAGIAADESLMRLSSFDSDYGARQTQWLLSMPQRPSAIIAAGMRLLDGVLDAIRLRGLTIPDDLSLIASNDNALARLYSPPISVIRYDPYLLGREAALMLLELIRSSSDSAAGAQISGVETRSLKLPVGKFSGRVEIPSEFLPRQSCRAWP